MMQLIDQYAHTRIWYDEDQSWILCQRFCEPDEFIEDDHYKEQMLRLKNIIIEKAPRIVLMDLRNFFYTVTPAQQEWIQKEILPPLLKIVQRAAFVLPSDLPTALSVEQIYEDDIMPVYPVRMFEDYNRALKWLKVHPPEHL
ncbi:MAG: hypothetical protein RMJ44_06670 [Cytophagales bacterium]|nr:hypothetical protein [Bernardetiaceae bacterium]MDW8210755.1 hypothetical protein [Cytophagales bacterium]